MNTRIYSADIIATLKAHVRGKTQEEQRLPRFIFVCGAADSPEHPARSALRTHVEKSSKLSNVFCLTAESVTNEGVFGELDLVTQEAMIADVADWLLIFAESAGSYCELGMFTALPHALCITSVAIDRRERNRHSFLNDGPVRTIGSRNLPLCNVYYLDMQCPTACRKLVTDIDNIRSLIRENSEAMAGGQRKRINREQSDIDVGSLVHELIDLINLLEPITCEDLKGVYCAVKGFEAKKLRIYSPIIEKDLRKPNTRITFEQVVDFMRVNGLVTIAVVDNGQTTYQSNVKQESYFMFKNTEYKDFRDVRARVLLRKRERKAFGVKSVYRHTYEH